MVSITKWDFDQPNMEFSPKGNYGHLEKTAQKANISQITSLCFFHLFPGCRHMICLWIDQNQERDNRRCLNTLSIQEPDILGTPKRVYKHIYICHSPWKPLQFRKQRCLTIRYLGKKSLWSIFTFKRKVVGSTLRNPLKSSQCHAGPSPEGSASPQALSCHGMLGKKKHGTNHGISKANRNHFGCAYIYMNMMCIYICINIFIIYLFIYFYMFNYIYVHLFL